MNKVYFFSESYIKENSELPNNLDFKQLKRSIDVTQDTFVQQLCGTAMYRDLQTQVISGVTDTDTVEFLEEYLYPFVLNMAIYKSLKHIDVQITNKGVVNKIADNSQTVEYQRLKDLESEYKYTADSYGDIAINYLLQKNSEGKFPLYSCTNNEKLYEFKAMKSVVNTLGGIYLG